MSSVCAAMKPLPPVRRTRVMVVIGVDDCDYSKFANELISSGRLDGMADTICTFT
jgi:hypothetical protein